MASRKRMQPIKSTGDILEMMLRSSVDPPEGQSIPDNEAGREEFRDKTRRKPIISINGEDVDEHGRDRAA